MHNLLKYRKGQFFILSIVSLSIILYAISKVILPTIIIDTSSVALREDFFIFNNIVEKSLQTLSMAKSCEDLEYNLGELKELVIKSYSPKFRIDYNYKISSCNDSTKSANVSFNISLYSTESLLHTSFSKTVNW